MVHFFYLYIHNIQFEVVICVDLYWAQMFMHPYVINHVSSNSDCLNCLHEHLWLTKSKGRYMKGNYTWCESVKSTTAILIPCPQYEALCFTYFPTRNICVKQLLLLYCCLHVGPTYYCQNDTNISTSHQINKYFVWRFSFQTINMHNFTRWLTFALSSLIWQLTGRSYGSWHTGANII